MSHGSLPSDFEAVVIFGLWEVFPAVHVYGCYFHLCLRKKFWNWDWLENTGKYGSIPNHLMSPSWRSCLNYFVERWLDNDVLSVSLCSSYGRWHRTTNAVEGWHSKINSMLGKRNPKWKMWSELWRKKQKVQHMHSWGQRWIGYGWKTKEINLHETWRTARENSWKVWRRRWHQGMFDSHAIHPKTLVNFVYGWKNNGNA